MFLDYLRPLWEDERGKISLGRVSFWIMFGFSLRIFYVYGDLSYNIVSLLLGLLAYGGFSKYVRGKFYNDKKVAGFGERHED